MMTDFDGQSVVGMTRRLTEERLTNEALQRALSEEQMTARIWAGHAKAWRSRAEHAECLLGTRDMTRWAERFATFGVGVLAGVVVALIVWRLLS